MIDRKLSNQTGLILLGLISLIFRYPITESPTGSDNFYYVTVVKATLNYGELFWAENLLSLYGLFPGTTPLGSIILATVIIEVSDLSVHNYHLLHSIIFSSIFTFGYVVGTTTSGILPFHVSANSKTSSGESFFE